MRSLIVMVAVNLAFSSCVNFAQEKGQTNRNRSTAAEQPNPSPPAKTSSASTDDQQEPSSDELESNTPLELRELTRCVIEENVSVTPDGGGVAPLAVTFDSRASTAPCGKIVRWNWDFGDGGIGKEQKVTHTYKSPGEYAVTLKLTDDNGHHNLVDIAYSMEVTGDNAITADRRLPSKAKAGNSGRQRRALQDSTKRNTK